ncbi:hypothetical protein [Sphingomonas sp. Leaf357]|uniref:hypothetical protein n=1 Tax=Sphingomonas sp. Leaf357 TaxID=1736350 RepID=UPI000ADEA729|nr:hypothetical protein [Sphingomonas sp. Leaf357]
MTATGMRRILLSGTAAIAFFGAGGTAYASGTNAGTIISNQANASYTVNGTPATVQSNTATFVVDRKVNLTVVADPNVNTIVNLGQTNAVMTFRVTNNTNGTQDFLLNANQNLGAGGTGTDNFDVTNVRVFVDSNNNGVYDAGVDTATFIDELLPDASAVVFIVSDVPTINGANYATVSLNATVAAGGAQGTQGAALIPTDLNLINQNADLDIVFADNDSDGLLGADIARNGQGRAYLEYEVGARAVNLSIVKTSTVLTDGVSTLNPKAIPGATVQYCLTVQNSTLLVPASNISLTDVIPANTTYVPGSIKVGGLGTGGVCLLNGFSVNDDGSPVPLSPYSGSFNATTKTVTAGIPTLLGGTSLAVSFQVLIN